MNAIPFCCSFAYLLCTMFSYIPDGLFLNTKHIAHQQHKADLEPYLKSRSNYLVTKNILLEFRSKYQSYLLKKYGENHWKDQQLNSRFLFQDKTPYKIMPLGNSITENNDPGYRGYLYKKLISNGFHVDFVGTKKNKPQNGGDPDNSGYGGFITGPGPSKGDTWNPPFKGNIYENLDSGYNILSVECDIIILEIGINDFFNNSDSSYNPNFSGAAKLDGLITKIFTIRPEVILVVSNITPVGWDKNFASVWNSEVPGIVEKFKKLGLNCYLADLNKGINWNCDIDLSSDKLHPSPSGNEKIAELYFKILCQILKK